MPSQQPITTCEFFEDQSEKSFMAFEQIRSRKFFEGIGELKPLTGCKKSNEKNGRCYEKRHLDELSLKNRHRKNRHHECNEPVPPQKNKKNVTTREVQDLKDDLLQECLHLEKNVTIVIKLDPVERYTDRSIRWSGRSALGLVVPG
jgi:hypothetical protein